MKPSEKLAAPRTPGSAETSFQTGAQTAEGLQLPKTWVTWTLGQLEKRKEWARELQEERSEEKEGQWQEGGAVRSRKAGLAEPWPSISLGRSNCPWPHPRWTLGTGWCPALSLRVGLVIYQPCSRRKEKPLWPSSLKSPHGKQLL